MIPHRTVVERGDTCLIELEILVSQPEGWFEYIPDGGDAISVYIKNKSNEIVTQQTVTVEEGNTERIMLNIPTNLPAGDYTYDVTIDTSYGEKHTICDEYILKIKEDGAYA